MLSTKEARQMTGAPEAFDHQDRAMSDGAIRDPRDQSRQIVRERALGLLTALGQSNSRHT